VDSLTLSAVIVASRPGALHVLPGDAQTESLQPIKNYRGIVFSDFGDAAARSYFSYLHGATLQIGSPSKIKTAARNQDVDAILESISTSQRSPLMLLLAFAASLEPPKSQSQNSAYLSRFILYRTICSLSPERKVTDLLERSHTLVSLDPFIQAIERLLRCYAMALRMLTHSALVSCSHLMPAQMLSLFGSEVSSALSKDVTFLSRQLGISAPTENTPLLPHLLQQVYYCFRSQ
jgi:hypothetical protein